MISRLLLCRNNVGLEWSLFVQASSSSLHCCGKYEFAMGWSYMTDGDDVRFYWWCPWRWRSRGGDRRTNQPGIFCAATLSVTVLRRPKQSVDNYIDINMSQSFVSDTRKIHVLFVLAGQEWSVEFSLQFHNCKIFCGFSSWHLRRKSVWSCRCSMKLE